MIVRHKKAFSMITAIFLILIMASLLALVSSLSGKVTKQTTNFYRKEQAALLAKSYTEFAILAIQGKNFFGNSCLTSIDSITDLRGGANAGAIASGNGYRVETRIQYIGLPAAINCLAPARSLAGHTSMGRQEAVANDTITPHLYATIDVYVMYHDTDFADREAAANNAVTNRSRWRTYHRRTVQKL